MFQFILQKILKTIQLVHGINKIVIQSVQIVT